LKIRDGACKRSGKSDKERAVEELRSVIFTLTSEPTFTGFSSTSRVRVKSGVELWVELAAYTASVIRISTRFREIFISAPCNLVGAFPLTFDPCYSL
jgi:hypothetical protein